MMFSAIPYQTGCRDRRRPSSQGESSRYSSCLSIKSIIGTAERYRSAVQIVLLINKLDDISSSFFEKTGLRLRIPSGKGLPKTSSHEATSYPITLS